jgi:hypothetical protein
VEQYPLTLALVLAPGYTLDDLAHADTAWPNLGRLRALGLFKLPGYTWGIDYITEQACEWPMATMGFRVKNWILLEREVSRVTTVS